MHITNALILKWFDISRDSLVHINFLAKKSNLKHTVIETDVQCTYADKNSSLARLSLTDEGSEFIRKQKPAHVEHSQVTIIHSTTEFTQFQKDKEKLDVQAWKT